MFEQKWQRDLSMLYTFLVWKDEHWIAAVLTAGLAAQVYDG